MKKTYIEGPIIESINKVGLRKTEEMIKDYPKLEAENNALQQQVTDALKRENDALKRENDAYRTIVRLLTKENYRDEEKEYSKSCLGLE